MFVGIYRGNIIAHRPAASGNIGESTFKTTPAIIGKFCKNMRLKINFLHTVLPHISNPEITGHPVEAASPWVAQAARPDFLLYIRHTHQGVVRRNGVRRSLERINPEYFGVKRIIVLGIVSSATVPLGDVQIAIFSEHHVAAIVGSSGLRELQQGHFTIDQSFARIGGINREAGDFSITVPGASGKIDEKISVRLIARAEGQAQQTLFVSSGEHHAGHVQKRAWVDVPAFVHDVYQPRLLYKKQAFIAAMLDVDRSRQTAGHLHQVDIGFLRAR